MVPLHRNVVLRGVRCHALALPEPDIATAFYLGYIWTAKYKGEEHLPFQYMETVYLFLTVVTNYIVYFLG